MNIDDPKLTAFALDELDEPERSTIAREIAQSPEAQRVVNETRDLARALKNEFDAELNEKAKPSRSLSDIRDDPWFWSIGRPLAIAAVLAIVAIVSGAIIVTHSRPGSTTAASTDYDVIEGEQSSPNETLAEFIGPERVPNPWGGEAIRRIDHVVIGELSTKGSENVELRVIETVNDPYRVQRLKERLGVPLLARKPQAERAGHAYALIFIDRRDQIIAGASFYSVADDGFVLQPLKNVSERGGRYFVGGGAPLPADWKRNIDYSAYVIQFPDWNECVGYAPGA